MTKPARFLLVPVGVGFLILGAVGALLPVLPGWPFFLAGLSILAPGTARRLHRRAHRALFNPETILIEDWRGDHGVHAGFTTKRFPLALKSSDDWLDPEKQRRFAELYPKTGVSPGGDSGAGRYAVLNQVHGENVVVLDDESVFGGEGFRRFASADGAITNIPRLALLVLTADCLPVFLCAARGPEHGGAAGWVGLVHAGWRGTRLGIVEKAVRLLCERGGFRPEDVRASFGPCIGRAHYEVGPEFEGHFGTGALHRRGKRLFFDLAGENRRRLLAAGLRPAHITDPQLCTVAENRHFHSFRREKDAAGRTISFIAKL